MRSARFLLVAGLVLGCRALFAAAQQPGAFRGSLDDPRIRYNSAPPRTAIEDLNRRLADGTLRLPRDPISGYLTPVLQALQIPVESQVLVYTKTSLQFSSIAPENPRAIYFNDTAAVGFVRNAPLLEAWALDPQLGPIFYSLDQSPGSAGTPRFARETRCLACHVSWETLAVPGPFVLTTFPRENEIQGAEGFAVDHRDDLAQRWGGWYVTGRRLPARHLGNLPLFTTAGLPARRSPPKASLAGTIDLAGYPTPYSDVAALMVLEHQAQAMNLMTLLSWEAHLGRADRVREVAGELADYLLFVDEAPIVAPIQGSSGFTERFSALGPADSRGRSLRDLQLDRRLMKYPLSYMIYSPALRALPRQAHDAVASRLRAILSGRGTDPKYAHLTPELRAAILEIVAETGGI
ncbi:MAG: hypothetical protein IT176_00895 [Acidobacteria bacterium]|nr:hypothetical protein [Acidobacteriota bacterium]